MCVDECDRSKMQAHKQIMKLKRLEEKYEEKKEKKADRQTSQKERMENLAQTRPEVNCCSVRNLSLR